jgi:hypothetical protein
LASTGDAEIYLSQPGLGVVPGARVLAEFGDDTTRYPDARGVGHHAALRQLGNRLVGIPPRTASGPPAFGQPDGTWIAETICCCR